MELTKKQQAYLLALMDVDDAENAPGADVFEGAYRAVQNARIVEG